MAVKNKIKNKDYLSLSFIIFFSFVFLCIFAAFFLFNILKLKDLNLNNSVFASTNISVEMLGFSDMTLSEFMKSFNSISSPDEQNILKDSPKKADKTALWLDLNAAGIYEENADSILSGDFEGVSGLILSQRGLCLLEDIFADSYKQGEIKKIEELCGPNSVDIKNIHIYQEDENIFLEAAVCVDIQKIRDKILNNFGYPVFEICGKLYFNCTYKLTEQNGVLGGESVSSLLYDATNEDTDKLINALFITYYMAETEGKYVINHQSLCDDIFDIITASVNNMGSTQLVKYEGERKDIKQNEIVLSIN